MSAVSITEPTIGEDNSDADPEIRTALSALVAGSNVISSDRIADGAFTAPKVALPSAIQSVALAGGVTWSGPLRFYKTTHGLVYLVGDLLSLGTSWFTPGTTIGTMPGGYRPGTLIYTHWFQWFAGAGPYNDSFTAVMSIDTDGTIVSRSVIDATFGDPYAVTPNSVSFRAEN